MVKSSVISFKEGRALKLMRGDSGSTSTTSRNTLLAVGEGYPIHHQFPLTHKELLGLIGNISLICP